MILSRLASRRLLIVALGLCIVIAFELKGNVSPRINSGPALAKSAWVPVSDRIHLSNAAMSVREILARPLFSPTRLPPPPDVIKPPVFPRLSGIIETSQEREAVFVTVDGKSYLAKEKTKLQGFVIAAITKNTVTITNTKGCVFLHLKFADGEVDRGAGSQAEPWANANLQELALSLRSFWLSRLSLAESDPAFGQTSGLGALSQ